MPKTKNYKIYPTNRIQGRILKTVNMLRKNISQKPIKTLHVIEGQENEYIVNFNTMLDPKKVVVKNEQLQFKDCKYAEKVFNNLKFHHQNMKFEDTTNTVLRAPKALKSKI